MGKKDNKKRGKRDKRRSKQKKEERKQRDKEGLEKISILIPPFFTFSLEQKFPKEKESFLILEPQPLLNSI